MKNQAFIILFVLSVIGVFAYVLLNRSSNTPVEAYLISYFVFLSLPFLLAYFFGWRKGFGLSIPISFIALWALTAHIGLHADDGYEFLLNGFFALFSVLYLFIAFLVFGEIGRPVRKSLLLMIVLVVIGWSILTLF